MDLELLIHHIDAALSAIMVDKGRDSKMAEQTIKLRAFVELDSSGFSELVKGISRGSKLFSNQKSCSSRIWATDARTVAVDILRGVSNIHWAAVGLFAVAIVLERLDRLSSNDKEGVDLLKGMSDLAKCIKQLHEISAHLHNEIKEKMQEGVYLIITGAMMCCSVIRSKKLSKFLLSTKIREELIFLRGQLDRMFRDLMFQVQLKTLSSLISYTTQKCPPETAGGFWLQSEKTVSKAPCEGQNQRNAISFTSEQIINYQNFEGGHASSSFNIGCRKDNNRYQRRATIAAIVREIGDGHKSQADVLYEHFVTKQGIGDLHRGAALFPYNEIRMASKDFHPNNKIGEWEFGSVYKGTLGDGMQLAIKQLSGQGKSLFLNERDIISRLQHRNIVKLFGCCVEGEETLLIYEYVHKGTLQNFLFDPAQVRVLDWRSRLNVIVGVARGLTYLHEDSGVGIVHRNIKPSNILLDENFNAKIGDFGWATMLAENNTSKDIPFAGTEGYIAPECMSEGWVTDKEDVFSFGVVILEVVSGRRSLELNSSSPSLVMLAWNLQEENRLMDLVDSRLINSKGFDRKVTERVIWIALQCTQEARLRPSMSKVLLMLSLSSEEEIKISTPAKPDYLCNS